MYAQLGSIQFTTLKGFTGFSTTEETNIVEHALIEGKPKLQRLGTNLDAIELTMLFDAAFCTPQLEIDSLNESREAGEILPLIMGNGRFVGNFVIKTVSSNVLHSADDGTILQAEVTASLLEHANSGEEATAASAIASAFANVNNDPQTFIPELVSVTSEMMATEALGIASSCVNTAASTLSGLEAFVELYRPKAESVIQNMLVAGDKLNDTLGIINADPLSELYELTRDLALKISETLLVTADVSVQANSLISDIDDGNTSGIADTVTSLVSSGTELSNKSAQLSQKSAALIAFVATQ